MVENIYRELGAALRQNFNLAEVILAAANDVDRPIFYSVAVIIAGYLPIYALTGPAGKLFRPMANTMAICLDRRPDSHAYAGSGARLVWLKAASKTSRNRVFDWIRDSITARLEWCLRSSSTHSSSSLADFRRAAAADPADRRRVPAASG